MSGYCTDTQVGYALTSQEITELSKQNGVATAAVITSAITGASAAMYSRMYPQISTIAGLNPTSYVADSYPVVEQYAAQLAADILRRRMRRETAEMPGEEHASLVWSRMVGFGYAFVPGA